MSRVGLRLKADDQSHAVLFAMAAMAAARSLGVVLEDMGASPCTKRVHDVLVSEALTWAREVAAEARRRHHARSPTGDTSDPGRPDPR